MASFAGPGLLRHAFAGVARKSSLRVRFTVLVCLVLIAGCFVAAATIQMRLDRAHALMQAQYFETQRADDIAAVAETQLDRFADAGRAFADHVSASPLAGVKNIAVLDPNGAWLSFLRGTVVDFPDLPTGFIASAAKGHRLSGAVLAFRFGGEIVAVQYDPRALVPEGLLRRALLSDEHGSTLVAGSGADGRILGARGKRWPIIAATFIDADSALASWRGALPLYLFMILGPALAGACLAPLFVGEFERRARASHAIRTLRSAGAMERRLLVRLAEAERRAVEGVRSKSEFIAHMSHELRTPLNAVIGFAEIIHKGLFGPAGHPKYVEYARDIAQAGRNLHGKIGDILEYANAEASRHPVRRELIDLWELASQVASEHQGQGFARHISLELGVSDSLLAVADRSAVRRIISILVANALSYARDDARIRLDVRAENGAACLVVRDSGVGFSSEERRRAGGAFVRFDRDGGSTGAGLGLAIATVLARRMGGALVIGGYHGLGAVIELRLPLAGTPSGD